MVVIEKLYLLTDRSLYRITISKTLNEKYCFHRFSFPRDWTEYLSFFFFIPHSSRVSRKCSDFFSLSVIYHRTTYVQYILIRITLEVNDSKHHYSLASLFWYNRCYWSTWNDNYSNKTENVQYHSNDVIYQDDKDYKHTVHNKCNRLIETADTYVIKGTVQLPYSESWLCPGIS